MNAAVDYIEENLAGEIDMGVAASKACCSEYHFTRFFSFIQDMPLSEYIRRRRLTLAGFMLQKSNVRVIEIATLFGYSSPNSFTRAFQEMHGVTPSEARRPGAKLNAADRLCFADKPGDHESMDFRIVVEGGVNVFGVSTVVKYQDAYSAIPAFIEKCEAGSITNRIVDAGGGDEKTLLKSLMWDVDGDMIKYMFCLDMPPGGIPELFETATVKAGTWAVFPIVIEKPEDSIVSVWKRIWTEWFPTSGYEQGTGPRQERCHWGNDGKMVVEAWVPVIRNNYSV